MNQKLCSLILHLPQTPRRFGGGQKPRLTSCCGLFSLRAATAAILTLNLAVALATSVFVLYRQVNAGADWEWLGDVLDGLDKAFAAREVNGQEYAFYSGCVSAARETIVSVYVLGELREKALASYFTLIPRLKNGK